MKFWKILKTISWQNPPQNSLVVWDGCRNQTLDQILLHGLSYTTIYTRKEKHYISWKIIYYLIRHLRKFDRQQKMLIYYLACLEVIRPKVVLTFIFTNPAFDRLAQFYPGAKFLTIQNGVLTRNDVGILGHRKIQHFFGMNKFQEELFLEFGSHIENFYPVGPLVGSFYRQNLVRPRKVLWDFCYISQYEEDIVHNGIYPEMREAHEINLSFLKRLMEESKFKVCVALRSKDDPREKEYFLGRLGGKAVLLSQLNTFSSYETVEKSEVILAHNSTLSVEAIDLRRKVFFMNCLSPRNYEAVKDWPFKHQTNQYEFFKRDLLTLFQMKYEDYVKLIEERDDFVMSRRPEDYACQSIRRCIEESLQSS